MLTIFKKILGAVVKAVKSNTKDEVDGTKILLGKMLALLNADKTINRLSDVEFKVFSQWGDDGIIQYLITKLDIPTESKIFVEFGVENYTESNTRFLLINNNWKGLVIDGSASNIDYIKKDDIYWKHHLIATHAFITKDNINGLITNAGIKGEIGILSIDIDGNDYWVWDAVDEADPIIVIVEYNSIWSYDKPYTIIYKEDFVRGQGHYSHLFYGSSLLSICDLGEKKGYHFIGCNSAGNNAYFIRKDKIKNLRPLRCKEGFVNAKFRESRDKKGQLSFLAGIDKYNEIKGLKIFNTQTNKEETI